MMQGGGKVGGRGVESGSVSLLVVFRAKVPSWVTFLESVEISSQMFHISYDHETSLFRKLKTPWLPYLYIFKYLALFVNSHLSSVFHTFICSLSTL